MPALAKNTRTVDGSGGITIWRIGSTPPPGVHDQIPSDAWDDYESPVPVDRGGSPLVPDGPITEVKAWVGDHSGRAQAALDAEQAGAGRATLIAWLEAVIADGAE
jgi:hypothetical protein